MQSDSRTTCSMARSFLLLAVLAGVIWPCLLFAQTDPRSARSQTPKEQELLQAQIDYYKAQTRKINTNPSIMDSVRENPASTVGVMAAMVAAIVTLVTFRFTYLTSLRTLKDSQFYDAIKQFGDQDNPGLRSGAATLMAALGGTKVPSLSVRGNLTYRYHDIAVKQLLTGLQMEENGFVLRSIGDALEKLNEVESERSSLLSAVSEVRSQLEDNESELKHSTRNRSQNVAGELNSAQPKKVQDTGDVFDIAKYRLHIVNKVLEHRGGR